MNTFEAGRNIQIALTEMPEQLFGECQICQSETKHEFIYEKWGYQILRCSRCGLGLTRIDGQFDPGSLYNEGYFQGRQRDGYSNYIGSEEVLRAEFRREIAYLRRFVRDSGRLLEIGSAYGFFLLEAQQYFKCMGLEVAEAPSEFCRSRGLDVRNQSLSRDLLSKTEPFDVAVMLDTIEHLESPAETIALLRDGLCDNGLLMISTGDWESRLARVMGRRWRLMTPPQHLFFFSQRSLSILLERNGFKVIDCVRPWKIVPLSLMAYQLGNRIGYRMSFLESITSLGIPISLFDTIRVIARKEGA